MVAVAVDTFSALAAVESSFDGVDEQEIRAFLAAHPWLGPLLAEAAERLPNYFPVGTVSSLALEHHPESRSQPELNLRVHTPLPLVDALERLDQFDEGWWLDAVTSAKGQLTITVWPT